MAVNQNELAADLKAAMDRVSDTDVNPAEARQQEANEMAAAIIRQILKVDVVVSGIVTTGSATTQSQSVPVKAKIS